LQPLRHHSLDILFDHNTYVYDNYVGEYGSGICTVVPQKMVRRKVGNKKPKQKQPTKPQIKEVVVYRDKPRQREKSGQSIGNKIGSTLGGLLGHGAQMLFKSLTGFGDYTVDNNSLMTGGMTPPDVINTTRQGGYIVRHREYLLDVVPSTTFSIISLPINPGLVSTFPWLSQVAASYEQYEFRGLVFEFKSTSSDAVLSTSASSALGSVIMATQYNALSATFSDKRTMENYEFANSCKPSCDFYHPCECKKAETSIDLQYVRTGAVTSGDLRLYDLGNFQLATVGMQNTTGVIGELWCTFEVAFYKPKLLLSGSTILSDHYQLSNITGSLWLGTAPILTAGSTLGTTVSSGISSVITFPSNIIDGNYLIDYCLRGISGVISAPTYMSTNSTFVNFYNNNASNNFESSAGSVTTWNSQFVIKVTGVAPTVSITGGLLTSATSADMIITQIDPNMI